MVAILFQPQCVREIPSEGRPEHHCSAQSKSWLLMYWKHKEPGHQQVWYWPSFPGIFQSWKGMINTLRLRKNGRHFPDHIFKRTCLNENYCILMKIPLKFVPQGSINNSLALVQIMAWCRSGNKPSHYDVKSQSFNPGLQYPHLHGPVHTPDNNRWDTPPV